jgi:hypothetical protein
LWYILVTTLLASWAACSCSQHGGVIGWITLIVTGGIITLLLKCLLCWKYNNNFTYSLLPAYIPLQTLANVWQATWSLLFIWKVFVLNPRFMFISVLWMPWSKNLWPMNGKQWSFNSLYSYWTCSYSPAMWIHRAE